MHKLNWHLPDGVPGKYAFVKLDGGHVFDAADVAKLLAGKRLGFVGDSMMHQFSDMLIVSLQKYGYERFVTRADRRYHCNGTFEETVEEAVKRLVAIDYYDREPRQLLDAYCDSWIDSFVLGGPFRNLTLSYYKTYRLPHRKMKEMNGSPYFLWPSIVDHVFNDSDVVLNLGLHYAKHNLEWYKTDLTDLGKRLEAINKVPGRMGIFKETSPQHFYSPTGSGEYNPKDEYKEKLSKCYQSPNIHQQLWRHHVMESIAGPRETPIMEGFWLQNMHDFHFGNDDPKRKRDCTHFAHVVEWWVPLFDSLFRTLRDLGCTRHLVTEAYCQPFI
eukprot:SM000124S25965  [mRNA]  locus=s124:304933:306907:- [translate_table: standard]